MQQTLVSVLQNRLDEDSEVAERGFTYLVDGEEQTEHLSYAELHDSACKIAAALKAR